MKKTFIPREPQKLIINFILDKPRCNIWGSMGLGKTSATLAALDIAYMSGIYTAKTLIIAPLRVAQTTWPAEIEKWNFLNINIQPVTGNVKQRILALKNKNANVFTINYENIPWLIEYLNTDFNFMHIVCDESTKLKSFRLRGGGKRAKALAKIAFKVETWVNLTGTPAPNGLLDLWGQNFFIDRGERLGYTYGAYTSRWFKDISYSENYSKLVPYTYSNKQIQDKLSDICLTLDASDWMPVDKPVFIRIDAILPHFAMLKYKKFERDMYIELENGAEVEASSAAAKTIKCLQVANGAAYTDDKKNWDEIHKAKLEALESIIEEAAGASVIVVYHWKHDLIRLQKAFKTGKVLDKDPNTIKKWNQGEIPILFIHPASAGHGISLQDGGNIMIFFSHWWNLEEAKQVIERIGPTRQFQSGYNRPVLVYEIIAKDTIDELVVQSKRDKSMIQDILTKAMKKYLYKSNSDDII